METEPKDQCRGMAPSETMMKVSAIDPMGLLGDHVDNDQEMREVEDTGNMDADPTAHKNVHVISASEGEEGEGSECGAQVDGSEPDTHNVTNSTKAGTPATHEKRFIIVDIAPPGSPAPPGLSGSAAAHSESVLMPPPTAKPTPAAAQVPDPALVKKFFQQIGEGGSQHAANVSQLSTGQGEKNYEKQNDQTESGSSKITESSCSETVLPKIKPVPTEADMIPPKTYKAIVANKKLKEKVGTIGGITSGKDPIECGSFYNNSDNHVARSVYKEDLITMSETWLCSACPKSHSVLEEGGRGGGDSRPVVFVTDQNFPAVLPSAEGRCLAIMRMEQASMDDLADMVIKLAKTVTIPESTVFVGGSLSHLSRVGTHGYAISCVNVRRRLSGAFKGVKVVPFSPPPPSVDATIQN
jgi:hypothetical protein